VRLERADRHNDMQRQISHNSNQELFEDIVAERERAANEKDPIKKAKREAKIAKMRADQELLTAQKPAPTFGPACRRWASINRNNTFTSVDWTKLYNGEGYKDLKRALMSETAKLAGIQGANRTKEEAQEDYRKNHWPVLQRQGEIEFGSILAGGRYDMNGKFVPATSSRVYLPDEQISATFQLDADGVAVTGGISVNVVNSFAIMAWLDGDDGPMLKRVLAKIAEANEGRPQISMAEKTTLIREQETKILLARRRLEAVIVHHETKEQPEYLPRIPGTPPEVLLWLERAPNASAPAPKPTDATKAKKAATLKDLAKDDLEGDNE